MQDSEASDTKSHPNHVACPSVRFEKDHNCFPSQTEKTLVNALSSNANARTKNAAYLTQAKSSDFSPRCSILYLASL
jgi:hypothetical protein